MNKDSRILKHLFLLKTFILIVSLLLTGCSGGEGEEEEAILTTREEEEVVVTEDEITEEDATETLERHRIDQAPVLVPYQGPLGPGGLAITERLWDASGLVGEVKLFYFESIGGSGEVQITAKLETASFRLEEQETSITTLVEAGKFYKLSVYLMGTPHSLVDEPRLIIEIEFSGQSSAQVLQFKNIGMGPWSMPLLLGEMSVEPWTPPPEPDPEPVWSNFNLTLIHELGSHGSDPGKFNEPQAVAADETGLIYVVDSWWQHCGVQMFSPSGEFIREWGSYGRGDGEFRNPKGIALDSEGSIYVLDASDPMIVREPPQVQAFTSAGQFLRKWGSRGTKEGQFTEPNGIAVGEGDEVYVTDKGNDCVQVFTSEGDFLRQWQVESPRAITVEGDGNLYILSNNRVKLFNRMGELLREWGSEGSGNGQFKSPQGIAVDTAGNIYVVDTGNGRLQVFDDSGELLYIWKWGRPIYYLHGVAIDYTGNLFVVWSHGVKVFLPESLQ